MVISALARHPYFTNGLSPATEDRSIPQSIDIEIADSETFDDSRQEAEIPQREIQADMEKILENLAFKYPNRERTALPIKMSVSEIAKERQITLAKPDFINENKITAAERAPLCTLCPICGYFKGKAGFVRGNTAIGKTPALYSLNCLT